MVVGPGLIVMEADNDAGAVSTYMQAGVQYGLHLLWILVLLLPICYFVHGRCGCGVTGLKFRFRGASNKV